MTRGPENTNQKPSDFLAKAGYWGEFTGVLTDAVWLANLLDLLLKNDEDVLGLSYPGIVFGITVALTATYCAAYCQRHLNEHMVQRDENTAVIRTPMTEEQQNSIALLRTLFHKLSKKEIAALTGYLVDRSVSFAGGPLFALRFVAKKSLSDDALFFISLGVIMFGVLCSIANVRSAAQSMVATKETTSREIDVETQSVTTPTENEDGNHYNLATVIKTGLSNLSYGLSRPFTLLGSLTTSGGQYGTAIQNTTQALEEGVLANTSPL